MANTYILIANTTLSAIASNVTFNSIPNTFTDLILRANTRDNSDGVAQSYITLQLNNSTTGFSRTLIRNNNGSSVIASGATGDPWSEQYPAGSGSTSTTNSFSPFEFYISNYNSTSSISYGSFGIAESNSTTVEATGITAHLWGGAAAITSIKINAETHFVAGSSFYLYGIKNA